MFIIFSISSFRCFSLNFFTYPLVPFLFFCKLFPIIFPAFYSVKFLFNSVSLSLHFLFHHVFLLGLHFCICTVFLVTAPLIFSSSFLKPSCSCFSFLLKALHRSSFYLRNLININSYLHLRFWKCANIHYKCFHE